jgi:hypothetical protein
MTTPTQIDQGPGYRPAPSQTRLFTDQQTRRVNRLPAGHQLVGVAGLTPIVRGPDGRLSRMTTSGRLVRTEGVQAVESYLLVQG